MSDRELLELAAKAMDDPKLFANNTGAPWQYWIGFCDELQCDVTRQWNPLDDDGDALRLAVALGMNLEITYSYVYACSRGNFIEPAKPDPCAALRRAIVRAAAEIGRSMP